MYMHIYKFGEILYKNYVFDIKLKRNSEQISDISQNYDGQTEWRTYLQDGCSEVPNGN